MNLPEQWKETFPARLADGNLVLDWVRQLEKDLTGFDAGGEEGPATILAYLKSWVTAMLEKHPDKLMESLYRADVSEYRVRAMIDDEVDAPFAIAMLLAEREARKVWFRKNFKA